MHFWFLLLIWYLKFIFSQSQYMSVGFPALIGNPFFKDSIYLSFYLDAGKLKLIKFGT